MTWLSLSSFIKIWEFGWHVIRMTITCTPINMLLTYSMVQSPWDANWSAASQETPRISRNEGSLPHSQASTTCLYPGPAQSSPYTHTSHLLEIRSNIIRPSMPRSPQWSPSLWFPHQHPIHHPLLTHTRHMPSPSHSSRFYHPHNIGWGVQVI